LDRRQFLKLSAGAIALPSIIPASALGRAGRPAPSDRITMALIGCGNQGMNDIVPFLADERVQVTAVCDVNRQSAGYWDGRVGGREPAQQYVNWHYGNAADSGTNSGSYAGCDAYEDFREVLNRPDIDTVLLALPDHWHAIPVVMAAKAGKDIYGEKPLSLTIHEGRVMSDAVRTNNRIFQTGSQQRSDFRFRRACELVRSGRIGDLHTVRVGQPSGTPDFGRSGHRKAPEAVPAGFNYDLWLGPAPEAPYSPARCHVNFRWIFDYSGGQVTDWGGHHPDIAQWGMNTEHTGPVMIRNARAVYSTEAPWNTAVNYYFECVYENGVQLIVSDENQMGVRFQGSEGWIWVTRGNWNASDPRLLESAILPTDVRLYNSPNHSRNFIDCVLSREHTVAPIETAHRSITIAHLGNIAMKLGRDLAWDPAAERFKDDREANALLSRPYRAPWKLEG
ncbi:MAG: Gfo/Idh/MocA family oxidoreductase, partial [Rhodothermales bacterium]|nr:Gfo/Idh/MocA family oxidoreductase [Rhodothermales bacterium]